MSANFQYRMLSKKDLPRIMAIERQSFDTPWSAAIMRDSLLAAHTQVWGIFLDSTASLVGFGVLSVTLDEAEVLSMSVDASHQRQGFGEKLLRFLIGKARDNGVKSLFLEVNVSHAAALKLYDKLGFRKIGVKKASYQDEAQVEAEDAVLLNLEL